MDLDRAHAEWTLGRCPTEELPELAAQMMILGFESPAILELASFHRPSLNDVDYALVERAFADCGRRPLSEDEARVRWVVALIRTEEPKTVLDAVSSLALCPDCDGPLSELARLAEDWRHAKTSLMRLALEDHVAAAGRRLLHYAEDRR